MYVIYIYVKETFGDSLSWADLITVAGATAIADAGNVAVGVCGGRSDAVEYDGGSDYLQPKITGNINETMMELRFGHHHTYLYICDTVSVILI
jgi:catalase (peroxidase I)